MILLMTAFCSLSALAQTVPANVPSNGLVGWWPFNGNANDESGNSHNGNVMNGALLTSDRNNTSSSAYSFDGINDYILISGSPSFINDTITLSFWINTTQNFTNDLIEIGNNSSVIWGATASNDWVEMSVGRGCAGGGTSYNQVGILNQGTWNNFTLVLSKNTHKLYKNGIYMGMCNKSQMSTLNCSSQNLYIGSAIFTTQTFFNGKLDDIGIWNRALTACEVLNLYNAGNGMSLSANSQTVCSGQPVVLTATGATNYTWSTGATSSSITVSPTANTIYSVSTSYSIGCTETKTVSVTVNQNPTVTAVSNHSLICVGETATLTANGALTYAWNNGGTGSAIAITPSVSSTYTVTGTDVNGCFNTALVSQSVSPCTSIEQLSKTDKMVNLYPNPTTSQLQISTDFKFASLQVLNSVGQLVFTKEASHTLDVSSLSHGIYFIKLYNEQGQLLKVAKFVKE